MAPLRLCAIVSCILDRPDDDAIMQSTKGRIRRHPGQPCHEQEKRSPTIMLVRILLVMCAAGALDAQVTFDRILHADKEPQNWLTYSGSTMSQRYSPLAQVTPANVNNLQLQWAFQARSLEKFESTPLVVDGTMYLTQAPNDVVALNA